MTIKYTADGNVVSRVGALTAKDLVERIKTLYRYKPSCSHCSELPKFKIGKRLYCERHFEDLMVFTPT